MFYEFQHFGSGEYLKKYYGTDIDFPSHLHQSFELILCLDGQIEANIDNKTSVIKKGDALLVFPHQVHSIKDSESHHLFFMFSTELVKTFANSVLDKIPEDNKFTPSERLIYLISRLTENASIIEKKGVLYTLCAEFDKTAKYKTRKKGNKNFLYTIFEFVEKNYNADCSLKKLCEETGFSYSYLSRYFKKIVGVSYKTYVNRYRINNACYLFDTTNLSILQCAFESGYDSLRTFNRNFYEITSKSPSEYKKATR